MAHNLEIRDGVAKMFYAGDLPWHGLGTGVDDAVTSADAIRLAGLDWTVELEPVFDARGNEITSYKAAVRDEDHRTLGIVGNRYQPIQNAEAFEFLDSLVQDRTLRYESAMALGNGETIAMLARMDGDFRIQGDIWEKFLLAVTSHDGRRALGIYSTSVRVVCNNTLTQATKAQAAARISHHGDIDGNMRAAREALALTTAEQRRMEAWFTELAKEKVSDDQVVAVRDSLFGPLDDATPTQRRKAIEGFMEVYSLEVDRFGQNAYTLANTVTGYGDHKVRIKTGSDRLTSTIGGSSHMFKRDGFAAIAKTTGITIPGSAKVAV